MLRSWLTSLPLLVALVAPRATAQSAVSACAQPPWARGQTSHPALAFLAPFGVEHFSAHHVLALDAFLLAEQRYAAQDFAGADALLDALWTAYPTGADAWGALPTQPFGINVGSPPAYYGLRMLTDRVDWRIASGVTGGAAPRSVRLTVLLVGASAGVEPSSVLELALGLGTPVVHALDPGIEADGYHAVHQSLEAFRDYVFAITGGRIEVETHLLPLPQLTLPVEAKILPSGVWYAGPKDSAGVFASVSDDERDATDWWWLIYPSHVPEQHPAFATAEFVTGGMGTGPDALSPQFVIDDRWLLRKPPHLGHGPYTEVERRSYLPQWLQHEFFHHLYRTYPEFGLEAAPHQWFDLSTWPPDFFGKYEADYYHESLVKRFLTADPPLHVALRYATDDAPWDQIELADVLGTYRHEPYENPWHEGTIAQVAGNQLRWTNQAGVSWNLQADLAEGELVTGPDCPYFGSFAADAFHVVLEKDALGDWLPTVDAFAFLGAKYAKL